MYYELSPMLTVDIKSSLDQDLGEADKWHGCGKLNGCEPLNSALSACMQIPTGTSYSVEHSI